MISTSWGSERIRTSHVGDFGLSVPFRQASVGGVVEFQESRLSILNCSSFTRPHTCLRWRGVFQIFAHLTFSCPLRHKVLSNICPQTLQAWPVIWHTSSSAMCLFFVATTCSCSDQTIWIFRILCFLDHPLHLLKDYAKVSDQFDKSTPTF